MILSLVYTANIVKKDTICNAHSLFGTVAFAIIR